MTKVRWKAEAAARVVGRGRTPNQQLKVVAIGADHVLSVDGEPVLHFELDTDGRPRNAKPLDADKLLGVFLDHIHWQ